MINSNEMSVGENASGRTMQITINKGLCFYPYSKRKGQGFSVGQITKILQRYKKLLSGKVAKNVDSIIFSDEKLFYVG